MQLQHVVARHHRRLVDDEHLAGKRGARLVVGVALPVGEVALVGEDKARDRLRLDPGTLGQVGDHLVLEGEAGDGAALGLRDARDRLEHGRLARAGDALHHHSPILRRDDQRRGRELAGVQFAFCDRL